MHFKPEACSQQSARPPGGEVFHRSIGGNVNSSIALHVLNGAAQVGRSVYERTVQIKQNSF
jgi:hypothetical protein